SRAAAAADVDGDGDIDLALGGEAELSIWLNDGTGRFARHPTAVGGDGGTDVVRLGFGDLDGDGAVDLVAGRGAVDAAPTRVLFNSGTGAFETAPAALPEVPLKVRALLVRDLSGDLFPDLVLGGSEMPVKLYVNRTDGRLEDRSFIALPSVEPVEVASLASGDWDGDCLADLVIGLVDGGEPLSWRGSDSGAMVDDGAPAVAGERGLLGEPDDAGDRDLPAIDGGAAPGGGARCGARRAPRPGRGGGSRSAVEARPRSRPTRRRARRPETHRRRRPARASRRSSRRASSSSRTSSTAPPSRRCARCGSISRRPAPRSCARSSWSASATSSSVSAPAPRRRSRTCSPSIPATSSSTTTARPRSASSSPRCGARWCRARAPAWRCGSSTPRPARRS